MNLDELQDNFGKLSITQKIPTQSEEQKLIINQFILGKNIKIEAVAGSGKTTTLLMLAQHTLKKCVILTYNKDLRDDIEIKINDYGIKNCQVYTYHAYASKLYCTTINTDLLLKQSLSNVMKKCKYNCVFLDEVQDMCTEYYEFIQKILQKQQLVIVGDRRQCINDYKGATADYLIHYQKYFDTDKEWVDLMLRTSYRLTPLLANFVNKNILNQNLIIGGNIGNVLPIYNYSTWNIIELIYSLVTKYGPEEVVILSPSTKSITPNTPLGKLISHSNIKFCQKEEDDKVLKGKVLISSYNGFKGRERKCVVVFGFDESYFEYYDKTWTEKKYVPNIIYMVTTRAKELLVLIQDDKKPILRCTNKNIINETCEVMGKLKKSNKKQKLFNNKYHVNDLINHRTIQDVHDLYQHININIVNDNINILKFENIIQFDGYYEDMKNYYHILILKMVSHQLKYNHNNINNINNERYNELIKKDKNIKEWMELVVIESSIQTGHYFYMEQISHYEWVNENFVNEAINRVINIIQNKDNNNGKYYHTINYNHIYGTIDYVENEIWLFKCCLNLKEEHYLQCATYITLYYLIHNKLLTGKIFNIMTNEVIEISINEPKLFYDILNKK